MEPIKIKLTSKDIDDLILAKESEKKSIGWLISQVFLSSDLTLEDFYYLADYCCYCDQWAEFQYEIYKNL